MDREERIHKLKNEYGFNEGTALAYIDSEGKCTYCGDDMFTFRQGYSSSQIDHLLPKKYKELEWNIKNWVFCCSSCNAIKHDLDVLKANENPVKTVENKRNELIERVKEQLSEKINKRKIEYNNIKRIVQSK